MKELISYEKGLVNEGNDARILNCMRRALKGEPIKVAFLGGSITQGSLSSTPEKCYAYLTYQWWKNRFPGAEFTYINAGIGGTTSHLGVGRVGEDVLKENPDFVIVEFSVNDADDSAHFKESYEGLVRRVLSAPCKPALLLVHNVRYDDGGNAEAIHVPIEKHYDVPGVSMKSTIFPLISSGQIDKRTITPDDLHPNDNGHELVASVITWYLEGEAKKAEAGKEGRAESDTLPAPLTENGYENAMRYRNTDIKPLTCQGFTADETPQSCIADCFKKGWSATEKGAKITFEVTGECIGVQYRKTVRKPAPIATLTVDGESEVKLDANFDEDWGDCLYLETVTEHGKSGKHLVEITITETHEDDRESFYLVSLITSEK